MVPHSDVEQFPIVLSEVMASEVYKDYIYVYGGYGSNGKHLNDFYRYSLCAVFFQFNGWLMISGETMAANGSSA